MNGRIQDVRIAAKVVHLTQNIASERLYASPKVPMSYVSADLRDLRLFASECFGRTVCISTLEHVGLNNQAYMADAEADPDSMLNAVHAICRVTRYELLITVPFHPEPMGNPHWRCMTPDDVTAIQDVVTYHGLQSEARYYAKAPSGGWYGGGLYPVTANPEGFPESVNAIVCLRCTR